MSISQPGEGFLVGGKTSMRLPLQSAGDQNGNAFPVSSSSSSSSSCPGESSPDSLRSLSSLSGGRTDSPLDVDMFEITVTTVMQATTTATDKATDVVVSKWPSGGEENEADDNVGTAGKLQTVTELSESNDNSVSVYLDANGGDFCDDTWNDNLTVAVSAGTNSGICDLQVNVIDDKDHDSVSSQGQRRGSTSPDSDATEIPADDDDDDDEDLFLSVNSSVALRTSSGVLVDLNHQPSKSLGDSDSSSVSSTATSITTPSQDLILPSEQSPPGSSNHIELQLEEQSVVNVPTEETPETGIGPADVSCPLALNGDTPTPDGDIDVKSVTDSVPQNETELPATEYCIDTTPTPTSTSTNHMSDSQESKNNSPPREVERQETNPTAPKTRQSSRATKTKPAAANPTVAKTQISTAAKAVGSDTKRFPKHDLTNVKSKVMSRATPSTPKTTNQTKPAPANERRVAPKKEDVQVGDRVKKQRSAAGQAKGTPAARPSRGRNADRDNLKTSRDAEAKASTRLEKRNKAVVASGMLYGSSSSLPSEVAVEGPPVTFGGNVQDLNGEVEKATGDPTKGTVEDSQNGTAGEGTVVTLERTNRHGTRVSSKLGPGARPQGAGSKGTAGPTPLCPTLPSPPPAPLGSGTGPFVGQGGPGSGGAQADAPTAGKEGQSTGAGSPARARPNPSQSQGIPKPRPSGLVAPGSGGRSASAVASKLPVKGLPASLSSSSLGSNASETNGLAAASKAAAPATGANRPEDRPSRSTGPPAGSHAAARPAGPSTAAAPANASANSNANANGSGAAPKAPAMRSRALSLQCRGPASGLKAPAVTHHTTAKTAAANQAAAKATPAPGQGPARQQTHNALQRSGSARLSRPSTATTVDKNKPRGAPAKAASSIQTAPTAASAGPGGQSQQPSPTEATSNPANANGPVTPVLPALPTATTTTTATAGTNGAAGLGFRARSGSRSSPKMGARPQNGPGPGSNPGGREAGSGPPPTGKGPVQSKQSPVKEQGEKRNQGMAQLRRLLVQGNRRVEALATVIQHVFSECEETIKQKKELSLELAKLREELVSSSQNCQHLQQEKEEVRVSLEEALRRLSQEHKEELAELEDRLKSFYQTEWDKVHQQYQEEANKCRALMEQQVEELRNKQEAERKEQEESHNQKMETLNQQYDTNIQELKRSQQTDLENLDKTLKETEACLSEKIAALSAENETLCEKLRAEEERRKILADKSLKDSHTVYLEQELESLKVVLEIKNTQLHQKDKKLLEMDKLVESNVKLEECLKKVQQENEDYKARMDKHAALSKQLSSEQAMLQQNLQKESKVNKRLSMENEELLWKLHNGDLLASPRRVSPTSPFHSPRNSASFPTAATLSPR